MACGAYANDRFGCVVVFADDFELVFGKFHAAGENNEEVCVGDVLDAGEVFGSVFDP